MTRRLVIGLFLTACCLMPIVVGCNRSQQFVDSGIEGIVWAKDGRHLIYSKNGRSLYRFDVNTGVKRISRLPAPISTFDISPDGKSIVFPMIRGKTYGIYVMNLSTGDVNRKLSLPGCIKPLYTYDRSTGKRRESIVYLKEVTQISWPKQEQALLTMDVGRGLHEVSLVDLDHARGRIVKSDLVNQVAISRDGGVFIYRTAEGQLHLYDLVSFRDKPLVFHETNGGSDSRRFLYLSKYQLVYVHDRGRQIDLTTMRSRPIPLPKADRLAMISPDLTRCLTGGSAHPSATAGWVGNSVYVTDLPAEVTQQMRVLEASAAQQQR